MPRAVLLVTLLCALAACTSTGRRADPITPPEEMAVLEPMIGRWTGTAEMVEVPGSLAALFPRDDDGRLPPLNGAMSNAWALGGRFLRHEGWFETAPGERAHYVEFTTWDPALGKFVSFYFNDQGETSRILMSVDPGGRTFRTEADGTRPDGTPYTGQGTLVVRDADTLEWMWTERSPAGRLVMRGTNRRAE